MLDGAACHLARLQARHQDANQRKRPHAHSHRRRAALVCRTQAADTIAVSHGTDTLTWEQLERNANRRARAFAAKGVKPGDFVAIGLPNSNLFFETTFAVWKCGATPTSLTWRLPRGEAAAVLDILKPSLVVGGQPDWNAPNSLPADFVPEGVSDEPIDESGGALLEGHDQRRLDRAAKSDPRSPARGDRYRRPGRARHADSALPCSTPARSITTRRSSLSHTALFHGGRVTGLVKFDAEECLRLIEANRVQWVNFVPTMMHRIWALPDEVRNRYDLSSLQIVFHMAAPMPPWLKEKWIEWLGPERIYELYGGTERQGATIISGVEWLAHKGSVGKIGETSRLRIIGEDGNEVATGETGEIYFLPNDGAGCTYHYLGAEPKRRPDGWESLGDIGRLDAEGYLYLGDRLADMILRGGANIYPAEIEAAVTEHPDVRSCVVVGLPDPEFGQRVHAILELDGSTDAQAVADGMAAFLADRLSRYKHPESFEVTSVGLRDDSGKVRRTLLRDERAGWLKEDRPSGSCRRAHGRRRFEERDAPQRHDSSLATQCDCQVGLAQRVATLSEPLFIGIENHSIQRSAICKHILSNEIPRDFRRAREARPVRQETINALFDRVESAARKPAASRRLRFRSRPHARFRGRAAFHHSARCLQRRDARHRTRRQWRGDR